MPGEKTMGNGCPFASAACILSRSCLHPQICDHTTRTSDGRCARNSAAEEYAFTKTDGETDATRCSNEASSSTMKTVAGEDAGERRIT
jgi:hypothetical protein